MTKRVTLKGGPLDGKRALVPNTNDSFTHHAATNGHYKVNEKTATWQTHNKPNTDDTNPNEGVGASESPQP